MPYVLISPKDERLAAFVQTVDWPVLEAGCWAFLAKEPLLS